MRNSTTFSISRERGDQLRHLSKLSGTTIADLISSWIEEAYMHNELRFAIPGFEVAAGDGQVAFEMQGHTPVVLTTGEAAKLAEAFGAACVGVWSVIGTEGGASILIRRRNGKVTCEIEDESGSTGRGMSLTIARRLAEEFGIRSDHAADKKYWAETRPAVEEAIRHAKEVAESVKQQNEVEDATIH